jgi:phosphopantetheinyl transferase (holo-ACP synthase)
MTSTGNDIVALGSVNKQRTGEFRFYSKILASTEQALYHQPEFAATPFENYVWLLWSVKESAYKYMKRINPHLVFSPTKIIITVIEIPTSQTVNKSESIQWEGRGHTGGLYSGKLQCGTDTFYFISKVNSEWISTVVNDTENFEDVCWGIQSIDNSGYEHQSKAVRKVLLNKMNSIYTGNLLVNKSPVGYPIILRDLEDANIPVSLAHDGHFVAYSFVLPSFQTN